MPRIETDDASVVFDDWGDGKAVVLVHGFPLDGRVWRDVADVLARSMRVIVIDLPGFGRSVATKPFTIDSLADNVMAVAEALKLEAFFLAGLSMGGYVALSAAMRYPTRLAGLVLVDTKSASDDETAKAGRNRMIDLVETAGTTGVVEQMLPRMFHPTTARDRPRLLARLAEIMLNCSPATISNACAAMRDRQDYTEVPVSLGKRLCVICGEGDQITPPEVSKAMAGSLGTLSIIEEAGHMAPIEQAERVALGIESFNMNLTTGVS